MEDEVTANQIGGSAALANTIAFNVGPGVAFWGEASGNAIRSNSIYSNVGLGIDLGFNGVTLNDSGDSDTGPTTCKTSPSSQWPRLWPAAPEWLERLTACPIPTSRSTSTRAVPLTPSGYGEGERWLGAITVTTNADGHANFDVVLPIAIAWGNVITATATKELIGPNPLTLQPAGNTSEFSAAKRVNAAPSANLTGPADGFQGVRGQLRSFTLAASDPSFVDPADTFTYAVNWGDGTTDTIVGPNSITVSHVYSVEGAYTASATATNAHLETQPTVGSNGLHPSLGDAGE